MVELFKFIKRTRVIKTIALNLFSKHLKNNSSQKLPFLIRRKSIISLSENSRISINNGSLNLGSSWFKFFPSKTYLIMNESSQLNISGNFKIYNGCTITINKNAVLSLGSGYLNMNSSITCYEKISIGEHVILSENVVIRDSDNHRINYEGLPYKPISAPIVIEDQVWIGSNVIILKGVRIGKGSVIAAGSVVTSNIPSGVLAGGVPAKVLRENITWS